VDALPPTVIVARANQTDFQCLNVSRTADEHLKSLPDCMHCPSPTKPQLKPISLLVFYRLQWVQPPSSQRRNLLHSHEAYCTARRLRLRRGPICTKKEKQKSLLQLPLLADQSSLISHRTPRRGQRQVRRVKNTLMETWRINLFPIL
jgi:hypothetical protein